MVLTNFITCQHHCSKRLAYLEMHFLMMASYSHKEWTIKLCFHGPSNHVWWAMHKMIGNSELCSIRSWDTATSELSDMNLHDKSRICEHLTCTSSNRKQIDIQQHVEEALTWSRCTAPMCGSCTKEKDEWKAMPHFGTKSLGREKPWNWPWKLLGSCATAQ